MIRKFHGSSVAKTRGTSSERVLSVAGRRAPGIVGNPLMSYRSSVCPLEDEGIICITNAIFVWRGITLPKATRLRATRPKERGPPARISPQNLMRLHIVLTQISATGSFVFVVVVVSVAASRAFTNAAKALCVTLSNSTPRDLCDVQYSFLVHEERNNSQSKTSASESGIRNSKIREVWEAVD